MSCKTLGLILGLTPFALGTAWVATTGTLWAILFAFLFGVACGAIGQMAAERRA